MLNEQPNYSFTVKSKPVKQDGQPYSDTSPYQVSVYP